MNITFKGINKKRFQNNASENSMLTLNNFYQMFFLQAPFNRSQNIHWLTCSAATGCVQQNKFTKFNRKTPVLESLFHNTYFYRTPLVAASVYVFFILAPWLSCQLMLTYWSGDQPISKTRKLYLQEFYEHFIGSKTKRNSIQEKDYLEVNSKSSYMCFFTVFLIAQVVPSGAKCLI